MNIKEETEHEYGRNLLSFVCICCKLYGLSNFYGFSDDLKDIVATSENVFTSL